MALHESSRLTRRGFVGALIAGGLAGVGLAENGNAGGDIDPEIRMRRIVGFWLEAERPKLIGNNARLGVHGKRTREFVWAVESSTGVSGFGVAPNNRRAAEAVLGTSVREYFRSNPPGMYGPFDRGDMPFWDLLGQLCQKPAYRLMGGTATRPVPVYDGSIYFSDLLPDYRDRGIDRILEEVEQGLDRGHRALKVKIGRGFRWMPRAEGDKRDVEVVTAIRRRFGTELTIMVDANNGYDLHGAKRLFGEIGPLNIFWAEEMFPENVEQDLEFKAFLRENGWSTLVADGEGAREPEHFVPFIRARALDVVQPDIRAFGLTLQLKMASMLRGTGIRLAPHNWGSYLGFFMQLHLACAVDEFLYAEHDPARTELVDASGYRIADGMARVPDAPGFGLHLDIGRLKDSSAVTWVVEA